MCATAKLLEEQNFGFWDLGMFLSYKVDLGGEIYTRDKFISEFQKYQNNNLVLKLERANIEKLVTQLI